MYSTTILGSSIYLALWLFLIFSFLGVLLEMIFGLVIEGIVESRTGLLYLPLRPLYGVGGMSFTLLLHRLADQPILTFLFGMVIGSAVEYAAGLLMEKAFGTRSWDYRDKRLNLAGHVCLQYTICWGLLAVLVVCILEPALSGLLRKLAGPVGAVALTVLLLGTAVSTVITTAALIRVRRRTDVLRSQSANGTVAERRWERLIHRIAPDPVVINSFPRMTLIKRFTALSGLQRIRIRLTRRPVGRWRTTRTDATHPPAERGAGSRH